MNKRVKKFSILDVKLAQGAAIFGVLIVAKLIPQIMDINILVVCNLISDMRNKTILCVFH